MARIKGRTDDMLIIRGVNVYPSQVEAALLDVEELAPHYQLVVDRAEAFPTLEVQVEPATGWSTPGAASSAGRPGDRGARGERGRAAARPPGAEPGDRRSSPPKTIPRSEGKAVRVVERRS